MSPALRRDLIAGAIAGTLAGFGMWWAMQAHAMMVSLAGLIGLTSTGAGFIFHLLISALIGASFGGIFRYQPNSHAATISSGLLYGLLWWILGPLTLAPVLMGEGPNWSADSATMAFPDLIGHLFYGGMVGLAFHVLVGLYLRRKGEVTTEADAQPALRRILILGGGFGGVSAAQQLEHYFTRDPNMEVTLVSQSNYLLFTPMLAGVASGGLEAQHISSPLRAALPHTRIRRATAEAIDTELQRVQVRANPEHPPEFLLYDHLILALGAVPNFHNLPGLETCSFTLKSMEDAVRLRNHVISLLERADTEPDPEERRRQLTFVVAGGGFAGAEIVAELMDLVYSVLRYYPHINTEELRFVLVHSRDRILPELSAELGEYALHKMRARGIEFILNTRLAGATPDCVQLNDGAEIPTYTVVWTAGNQPNPLVKTLPYERTRGGALAAESTLRVKGAQSVWVVGDCAQIPDPDNDGKPFPPTAQHALRQGKWVADNVAAAMRGASPKPFRFHVIGTLVALGHHMAVAEIRGFKFSGLLAWMMWRSIYLAKLPGLEKKVRVALDWIIELFFPRDIVLTMGPTSSTTARTHSDGGDRSQSQAADRSEGGVDDRAVAPPTSGEDRSDKLERAQ